MKKILGLTIAALLVMALVGGGTWAYFSDVEAVTENTFTAGTLDLELTDVDPDGFDTETQTWVFSNMYPTDANGATLTLTSKAGSIDGYIDLDNIIVADDENDPGPESETTGGFGLSDLLKVHMFFDVDGNGSYDAGDTDIYGTSATYEAFSGMLTSYDSDYALTGGSTTYITLNYDWPSSVNDNDAQGDITTFTFDVILDQTAD